MAPLTQEYTDTGLVDNNAYYNQAEYTQGAYDYTQYSDTDRLVTKYELLLKLIITIYFRLLFGEVLEPVVTIPMAITAFLAALLGGIMAPIVGDGMRALMEFELPEIELPRIKKSGSGEEFDNAVKMIMAK